MFGVKFLPDKSITISTHAFDLFYDIEEVFLRCIWLLFARVKDGSQLIKFAGFQATNINQVDKSAAIFKLLLTIGHVFIELFDLQVTKCLTDGR